MQRRCGNTALLTCYMLIGAQIAGRQDGPGPRQSSSRNQPDRPRDLPDGADRNAVRLHIRCHWGQADHDLDRPDASHQMGSGRRHAIKGRMNYRRSGQRHASGAAAIRRTKSSRTRRRRVRTGLRQGDEQWTGGSRSSGRCTPGHRLHGAIPLGHARRYQGHEDGVASAFGPQGETCLPAMLAVGVAEICESSRGRARTMRCSEFSTHPA